MVVQSLGKDQDVVDVSSSKQTHVLEYIVHCPLKGGWSVAQDERNELVGEGAILCAKCRSLDMLCDDSDLMEA